MVKNYITEQIKHYRIDEEHKQSLLDKVKDFDRLYVQEKFPDPRTTLDNAQQLVNHNETTMPTAEKERPIDADIPSEILAA